jgi:hypothetical protein
LQDVDVIIRLCSVQLTLFSLKGSKMAKPYDAAIDTLINMIDDSTTNCEKLVAAVDAVVQMEKYVKDNPNAPDLKEEYKTLTYIYNTLSNVCRISAVECAANALVAGA